MKTKLKTGSIDTYDISDEIGRERPLVTTTVLIQ